MSTTSIDKVIEIKEWIEGPKLLLLFTEDSLPLLDESVLRLVPAAISTDTKQLKSHVLHLSGHVDLFDFAPDTILIDDQLYDKINEASALQAMPSDHGVIISGSVEEVVGVKSFDKLDTIFDILEE